MLLNTSKPMAPMAPIEARKRLPVIKAVLVVLTLLVTYRILSFSHVMVNNADARRAFVSYLMESFPPWRSDSSKPRRLLIIAIMSKRSAVDRRNTIRDTWMKACRINTALLCLFFTDNLDSAAHLNKTRLAFPDEQKYHDIILMNTKPGLDFSSRLLEIFEWVTEHYTYDFLLRVDDDYFLCVDHLYYDVFRRPKTRLYWGWLHCIRGQVRIDEGWMIVTSDIVDDVLARRNTTLLCHPFGDQAVAMWMLTSRLDITYFADNDRVVHQSYLDPARYLKADICHHALGVHKIYPDRMTQYWNLTTSNHSVNMEYAVPPLPAYESRCSQGKQFVWQSFIEFYRFEPKPCRTQPNWNTTAGEYTGGNRPRMG